MSACGSLACSVEGNLFRRLGRTSTSTTTLHPPDSGCIYRAAAVVRMSMLSLDVPWPHVDAQPYAARFVQQLTLSMVWTMHFPALTSVLSSAEGRSGLAYADGLPLQKWTVNC